MQRAGTLMYIMKYLRGFTSEVIGKHRIRSHRNPAFPSIVIDIIPGMRGTPCDEGDG